jgi:hypothetical protein
MALPYFKVADAFAKPNRWYLRPPVDKAGKKVNPEMFTDCKRVAHIGSLEIPLRLRGVRVDFTFGALDMIVVHRRVGLLLEELCGDGIQRIPVRVEESTDYEILNVLDRVKCIDEERSRIMWWNAKDGRREKLGQYRMISRLEIDPSRTEGKPLFRLAGWEIALIASDLIKGAFERAGVTGAKFWPLPWDACA